MLFCRLIGSFSIFDTLFCKLRVNIFPQTVSLCRTCRHIKCCSSRGRFNNTFFRIIGRCKCKGSPFCIMYLMIYHSSIISACNHHFEHPFHLISCFIKKIRITVCIFRYTHSSVRINSFTAVFQSHLILILHCP